MYVTEITIENLRYFERETVGFVHPDEDGEHELGNVTLLVGDNGAGKTTVLRAVCLVALNKALMQSGYVPHSMVRRTPSGAEIEVATVRGDLNLHRQDCHAAIPFSKLSTSCAIKRKGDVEFLEVAPQTSKDVYRIFDEEVYRDDYPGVLLLGYGANRRIEPASEHSPRRRRRLRTLRYDRVASLFEDQVALISLASWLPELRRKKRKLHTRVRELFDELIPKGTRFTGKLDGDEYLFERGGVKVHFSALSDGYRGYIGLLSDMFCHICAGLDANEHPAQSRGVVLIDEIGLHLHPSWQRTVVPTLARTLPEMQFVLTSHRPIVAGTVHAKNIRVLEVDEHGVSHLETLDEDVHGLHADQILLTEAFGLDSSRAPDVVARMEELRRGLGPESGNDALRLMNIMNRGSAGDREPVIRPASPWARRAAEALREIAEDKAKAKRRKTKPDKKLSNKKKSRRPS